VETPGADELEAPPTGPSNGSWGRRSKRLRGLCSHPGPDWAATRPGLRSSTPWNS